MIQRQLQKRASTMVKIGCTFLTFLFFLACGGEADPSKHLSIELEGKKTQLQQNQQVGVTIRNKKNLEIGTVTYSIDGRVLPIENNKITLNIERLGNKTLIASVDHEGKSIQIEKKIKVLAAQPPQVYTYDIVNTYPHDPSDYTQGLEFDGQILYESTGKKGFSKVKKLNFETGAVLKEIDLDKSVFGEGITQLNGKLYHLTWQSGLGYIYDSESLERQKTFNYGKSREGWGLCNDGQQIYKSDGTEKIWLLEPETMLEQGYIETVTNKSIFNKANELEYVDGKIYANVYQKESMMIIDATSGAIEGVINFGGLKSKVARGAQWDDTNSVLNGVAYHKERGTFFVTGKNWDKLFEVRIKKK